MRPERESRLILAAVQARAKMHEFRAAEEDYVPFRRAPETLFPLAAAFGGVTDRIGVRRVCRTQRDELNAVLDAFPAYFQSVAEELRH